MKRRSASKVRIAGTVAQVVLVGVLLLAVVWQLDGAATRESDPPSAPAPSVARIEQPSITTDDVNIRRGPGLDHDVITVLPKFSDVTVTGAAQNGFLPVTVEGAAAWVSDAYVVPEGTVLGATTGNVTIAQADEQAPDPEVVESEPATEPIIRTEPNPVERMLVSEVSAAEVAPASEPEPEPMVAEETWPVAEPAVPEEPAPEPVSAVMTAGEPDRLVGLGLTGEGERWVDVNRTTGVVSLYEGQRIVAQFDALVGKDPSPDGFYSTAVGTFHVHMKNRELTETPFAPGVYLTDFVGFDHERSNGFHSPVRDASGNVIQTGGETTLGCVRLGEDEAKILYDFAFIGMRVEVHD